MKDVIKKLNDLSIRQMELDFQECIPLDIWNEYFKGKIKVLEINLYLDERRWYEKSTTAFSLDGSILGVTHITKLYSEQNTVEDVYHTLEFFEMEEKKTITYIKKQETK